MEGTGPFFNLLLNENHASYHTGGQQYMGEIPEQDS